MATREKKAQIIEELNGFFKGANVAIIANVSGLTVAELTKFRRSLAKDNARCRIAKNTLMKISTQGKDYAEIKALAKGPSAIIIGYDDPAQPAKTVLDYFKAIKKGSVRGAVLEGRVLKEEDVKNLASLPSKEQLLSSIMGALDSGARGIAGTLESIIRDIALLAEEVAKKNAESGGVVQAAVAAEPAPAEPAPAEANPLRQGRIGRIRSGRIRSGRGRIGRIRSGRTRIGRTRIGRIRSGRIRSGRGPIGRIRSGPVRSGEAR